MDIVTRPFTAEGILRDRGEIVDAGAWKHAPKLRERRYLAPFKGKTVACKECGRKFVDDETLQVHAVKEHGERVSLDAEEESHTDRQGGDSQSA